MLGKFLIYIAFAASIVTIICFFKVHLKKDKKILKLGRLFFHITAISVISSAVFLLYLILTHQFQYAYVYEYSDTQLQLPLLISTFYAGQEGSFMLWTLFTVIIGVVLLNYVSNGDRLEPQVMSIYTLVIAFLTLIMILKSPFNYIWEMFPGDVKAGFIPEEGRGLNPLLQNFWMTIHPPILFIGFASLTVPFSFAIGAMMKNKYNEWVVYSMPWMLFSGGVLGLGIMMGGYWAYSILGWGGYWGWDPVENSSLIPWIITVAGIHTMLIQKKSGGYKKTNLILGVLAFLLVLYSTFLTRSGVLGESSVHSFVDPGAEVYLALVLFISLFIIISLGLILFRLKDLKSAGREITAFLTKETFLFIGSLALCASALVITAGTSWPLITKGTIEPAFYNRMTLPIAMVILAVMGLSILLEWKQTNGEKLLTNLGLPLILSVISSIGLIIIGVNDLLFIIFTFLSLLAFFINIIKVLRILKTKKAAFGGALAHVGLALFFLGVIGSSKYSNEAPNVSLEKYKPVEIFGYKFTYTGYTSYMDANNKNDSSYYLNVAVEKGQDSLTLRPTFHPPSKMSNGDYIKNPDIASFMTKDLYIAALGIEAPKQFEENQILEIKKGEKKKFGDLTVEFEDFDFGKTQKGGKEMESGNFTIGGKLKISDGKNSETVIPQMTSVNNEPQYQPAKMISNTNYLFYFVKMNVKGEEQGGSTASIVVQDLRDPSLNTGRKNEVLIASISTKPFIGILWAGVLILVIGFIISIIRRRKELLNKNIIN